MEAQARTSPSLQPFNRRQAVAVMAVLWAGIHIAWLLGPVIAPDHDFESTVAVVTGVSLTAGLFGLSGLWNGTRWGWWTALVACIMNVILAVPEAFGLPGILRVVSVIALAVLATCLILLFRPGVRPVKA